MINTFITHKPFWLKHYEFLYKNAILLAKSCLNKKITNSKVNCLNRLPGKNICYCDINYFLYALSETLLICIYHKRIF